MKDKKIYINLDGVILDTNKRLLERMSAFGFSDHTNEKQFNEFVKFANLYPDEWDYIINKANSINESVEIMTELQRLNKNVSIISRVNSLYEMKVKIENLRRNRRIYSPIFFVPPGIDKHQVAVCENNILVDNSKKDLEKWISRGGIGIEFDEKIDSDTKDKVKSLKFLIDRSNL